MKFINLKFADTNINHIADRSPFYTYKNCFNHLIDGPKDSSSAVFGSNS